MLEAILQQQVDATALVLSFLLQHLPRGFTLIISTGTQ